MSSRHSQPLRLNVYSWSQFAKLINIFLLFIFIALLQQSAKKAISDSWTTERIYYIASWQQNKFFHQFNFPALAQVRNLVWCILKFWILITSHATFGTEYARAWIRLNAWSDKNSLPFSVVDKYILSRFKSIQNTVEGCVRGTMHADLFS